MSRPTFVEGVGVALAASMLCAAVFTVLTGVLPGALLVRLVVAGAALAYVLYLLARAPGRTGRVTALALWSLATAGTLAAGLSIGPFVAVQAVAVWLVRSVYFQSGPLGALADGVLVVLGLVAAGWALITTASVFLAVWSGLLVQALFVAVPGAARARKAPGGAGDRFEQAARSAESAARRLSTRA